MSKSIFLFTRDLRITDNLSLKEATDNSEEVLPVFLFDKNLIEKKNRNEHAIKFLMESVKDLNEQIESATNKASKLHVLQGFVIKGLERIYKEYKFENIYLTEDYTPYSKKRLKNIKKWANEKDIKVYDIFDRLLAKPNTVLTDNNDPYKVFTPFYKKALEKDVLKPLKTSKDTLNKLSKINLKDEYPKNIEVENLVKGTRNAGLNILKNLDKFDNYKKTRDEIFNDSGTTKLSAYNKFGNVSIREVYWTGVNKLGKDSHFISEVYWRDFFTHVAYFFPNIFNEEFLSQYKNLKWDKNSEKLEAWKQGKTGFPIVDAGMRELNKSGYMHNRTRMIVSSFLTKDLHIDWREGEKYFEETLTDYDITVNVGSWQWAASTGVDAAPYFRIFNPWTQQKKFDPECIYIKKWIPELKNIDNEIIHKWDEKNKSINIENYPAPIVDHSEERKEALKRYKIEK